MKIKPSKHTQAVIRALTTFGQEQTYRAAADEDATQGPRGIVNARRLGLSLNKPKKPQGPKRIPARESTFETRKGCVRGKDLPSRLKGYSRKVAGAQARMLAEYFKNNPSARKRRDQVLSDAKEAGL